VPALKAARADSRQAGWPPERGANAIWRTALGLLADFREAEQVRMAVGTMRANARRAGDPPPIIMQASASYEVLSTEPLPPELGGDGRMPSPAPEVPPPSVATASAEARNLETKLAAFGVKIATG
jgi:hypothetical protein